LLQEVQRRDPCDKSLLTLGCLGIGKKIPAGAKVWEDAQPRAKVLLKGDTIPRTSGYTPKLELLNFFVNQRGQETLLSPDGSY